MPTPQKAVQVAMLFTLASAAATGNDRLIVCFNPEQIDLFVIKRAQMMASRMFADADVDIDWRTKESACGTRENHVEVRIAKEVGDGHSPKALAHAFLYEGTRIELFYHRIQNTVEPNAVPFLLAHVLVHEIGHLLQGVHRHATTGVMKAHWDLNDHRKMRSKPLPFTGEDILLLKRGIERRNGLRGL